MNYHNYNWQQIVTPIKVDCLREWLFDSKYDKVKMQFLVRGFTQGFDLGYRGPENIVHTARNLLLRVGSPTELWNKIMLEVKAGCYAGTYLKRDLPMKYFKQSPIGLVPKSKDKTRLIFHLSYNFGEDWVDKSFHTPEHLCSVKYNDLDHAVHNCLKLLQGMTDSGQLFYAKTDCSHAFRIVPALVRHWKFLVMMAHHPITKERYFFIDLCLPFGASISFALFQSFSDALKHLAELRLAIPLVNTMAITNYLDDFLFIAITLLLCNGMVHEFLFICERVGCPISVEKTEWASQLLIFLGILLNGQLKMLMIPDDKRVAAINLL